MQPLVIAVILYFAAIGLALLDLYVPSAGMLVLLSFLSAVGSVLFGFQAGTTAGMTMLTLVAGSVPVLAIIAFYVWPHTPIGRRIVLGLPEQQPAVAATEQTQLSSCVGRVVVSEYPLMPGGQITIDRRSYNALAEVGYIDAGQRVEVVGVRHRNLIVRVTDKPENQLPSNSAPSTTETAEARSGNLLDVPADQLGLDSIEN